VVSVVTSSAGCGELVTDRALPADIIAALAEGGAKLTIAGPPG